MWSIYDTLILVTGILTVAIAAIPLGAIEPKMRLTAGLIGGGVILLALILGSLQSFSYPSLVVVAPLVPLVAAGAIVRSALDAQKHLDAAARGDHYSAPQQGISAVSVNRPTSEEPASGVGGDPRADEWAALFELDTTPERLAQIAASYPEFAAQIAQHPRCYPELHAWAAGQA